MAKTPSTMLPILTPAPPFSLPDLDGKNVSLAQFKDKPILIMFICNHCPFVKHIRNELARLGIDFSQKGIAVIAINSNDISTHPEDSPEKMRSEALEAGYAFPYLFDASQSVAKAYAAACTPDFYLFDKQHKLYYRGQLDESRPGNAIPVSGKDLRHAAQLMLAGQPSPEGQRPSLGCNIKWRSGQEPDYFKH